MSGHDINTDELTREELIAENNLLRAQVAKAREDARQADFATAAWIEDSRKKGDEIRTLSACLNGCAAELEKRAAEFRAIAKPN